eukprot:4518444-Prymnesium_polylepis.1
MHAGTAYFVNQEVLHLVMVLMVRSESLVTAVLCGWWPRYDPMLRGNAIVAGPIMAGRGV